MYFAEHLPESLAFHSRAFGIHLGKNGTVHADDGGGLPNAIGSRKRGAGG